MDFYTTILSIAGTQHEKNDGENLLPVLSKNKVLNRDKLFWHFPHYHGSGWKPGSAMRKGNWKLVVHYEDNRAELFNLAENPGETSDVSGKFPEKTRKLKNLLNERLMESNALFPQNNITYLPVQ